MLPLGCLEEERTALLQLKDSSLSNGNPCLGKGDARCCDWYGVGCSSSTGRVTGLDLSVVRNGKLGDWYLNASLFLPFQELITLVLMDNQIAGWVENKECSSNLETLYLSGNNITKVVASGGPINVSTLYLNNITSYVKVAKFELTRKLNLDSCSLDENSLQSSEHCLSKNLSLQTLSGALPFQGFLNLKNLELMDLSYNTLNSSSIFRTIQTMTSLKILRLQGCSFNGQLPISKKSGLFSRVTVLLMSDNGFDGSIPSSLGSMSSLQLNNLSGPLPPRFSASSKLRYVYLSRNKLQGPIAMEFYNSSRILALDLSHNNLTGRIPEWIGRLYNLRFLLLSHNNFEDTYYDNLSSSQQSFEFTTKNVTLLYKGSNIRYFSGIDFSCNNFTGEIPPEIGILSKIKVLNLSHNSLIGPIPQHFQAVFSVAHNNLSGKTPARVAQFATFEESSYKDNPFLCGQPLIKTCDVDMPSSPMSNNEEKGGFMDMEVFYVSFGVAYIMVLLPLFKIHVLLFPLETSENALPDSSSWCEQLLTSMVSLEVSASSNKCVPGVLGLFFCSKSSRSSRQ
uniref:Leucine-rich repeat-containing N-terminal plant-type domain-containing protein n=1 Tax=Salix viminalis TaxID=40686 RepID=A0A6N2M305_SALVM